MAAPHRRYHQAGDPGIFNTLAAIKQFHFSDETSSRMACTHSHIIDQNSDRSEARTRLCSSSSRRCSMRMRHFLTWTPELCSVLARMRMLSMPASPLPSSTSGQPCRPRRHAHFLQLRPAGHREDADIVVQNIQSLAPCDPGSAVGDDLQPVTRDGASPSPKAAPASSHWAHGNHEPFTRVHAATIEHIQSECRVAHAGDTRPWPRRAAS